LESLQNADGSFPSLIPGTGDQDVDSTAMAAMALALAPGTAATADVSSAVAWIAGRQEKAGGFPGVGGDSINSAGLAIQAMSLRARPRPTRPRPVGPGPARPRPPRATRRPHRPRPARRRPRPCTARSPTSVMTAASLPTSGGL